jgi:hypothetical protein
MENKAIVWKGFFFSPRSKSARDAAFQARIKSRKSAVSLRTKPVHASITRAAGREDACPLDILCRRFTSISVPVSPDFTPHTRWLVAFPVSVKNFLRPADERKCDRKVLIFLTGLVLTVRRRNHIINQTF